MSAILGDIAVSLRELSGQLNSAECLLADSIQQDDNPRLAASSALEIMLSASAELKLAIGQLKAHLAPLGSANMIAEIQHRVATHFGIPLIEMKSDHRARAVSRPRQIAMYLAKQITAQSSAVIGSRFGGRDHTTVIHAINRIENLMATDPRVAECVTDLRRELATK